ncbi:MAG: N-acetyltransferase [Chloroflexi bacterium]|nr:N-acetyltransferase [Chloroflexota bacterium]
MRTTNKTRIERAKVTDVPDMHRLINFFAQRDQMLARPLSELYENVRDFYVARHEGKVVACVALHVSWCDLAEIKALAVEQDKQKTRIGSALVKACLKEARQLGMPTVFCLTYKPEFFQKLGFKRVDLDQLPRKVWGECQRCAKFPHCDEIALTITL